MWSLEWEEKGIRVDGRFLSNLRFADDIVLLSKSTNEAEAMLCELNEVGKRIGLQINRAKTQFMKNAYCEGERIELDGCDIKETSSYVYLGRSMNMENNLIEELDRRRRAAWAAFGPLREATDQLTDLDLRAHFFDSTVLPALCYVAETWEDTAATSKTLRTIHRALERCCSSRYNRRTQHQAGLRSSDLRQMSRLCDPAEYVSKAKHRWAGNTMRREDNRWTKRTLEWIPRETKRRETTNEMDRCVQNTDGPAERSAGKESELSPTSSTKFLDDGGTRTNRMEAMLGPPRHVTTGHLSIYRKLQTYVDKSRDRGVALMGRDAGAPYAELP